MPNNDDVEMNTKLLMSSSAVVMAALGAMLTFLPDEILNCIRVDRTKFSPLFLQMSGALYFGFALLNWTAKLSPIGGIYGRPVAIGNFMHFVVGAFALIKSFFSSAETTFIWIPTAIYIFFAALFSVVLFGNTPSPNKHATS